MVDPVLKEIETNLQNIPHDKCLIVILRAILRVLPLLTFQRKQAFAYWPEETKSRHLLAILTACSHSLEYALSKKCIATHALVPCAIAADNAAIAADTNTIASAIARSAAAMVRMISLDIENNAENLIDTSDNITASVMTIVEQLAAVATTTQMDSIIDDIQKDLYALAKTSSKFLLQQPLCSKTNSMWLELLANFKMDALSLKAGFEVWLDWYDERLNNQPINIALLKQSNNLQEQFYTEGPAVVNSHLKELQSIAIQPLNRVRALFIGATGAGKTSLIHALHGEPITQITDKQHSAAIDIRNWSIPDTDITAHLWDFDSLVINQTSYKLLLRPMCLYVLVITAQEPVEYWLTQIQDHAKNARVMIVGNKIDLAPIHLNMAYLKEKYSNIIDFYPLCCTQTRTHFQAEFLRFQRDFCEQLQQIGIHKILLTKEQLGVLDTLDYYSNEMEFLSKNEFNILCMNHGINTTATHDIYKLLDILDKLGTIIYFPQTNQLERYLLNPRWLTYGINTLITKNQNPLTLRDSKEILNDRLIKDENQRVLSYPTAEFNFLIHLMQQFKLCYLLPHDSNAFILPELLPIEPLDVPFDKTDSLQFEIEFNDILSIQFMFELICNCYREIAHNIVWQKGVLLKYYLYQAYALLEFDEQKHTLAIWITGNDAQDFFSFITDEINEIIKPLQLTYKIWFVLPQITCTTTNNALTPQPEKILYQQMMSYIQKNHWSYISESGLEYNLRKILHPTQHEETKAYNEIDKFQNKLISFLVATLLMVLASLFFKDEIESIQYLKDIIYFLVGGIGFYFFAYRFSLMVLK